jgi:hypothetical protein
MKNLGLLFHGALVIVAASLAWWAWHDDEPALKEGSGPVLADIEAKDLESVEYKWPDGDITVTPREDGEDLLWTASLVHEVTEQPEKKAGPEPAADAGPAADGGAAPVPEPVKQTVTDRFPGGRMLVRSVEKLAPLKARRSLGKVEADRLPKMGLDAPERKLVVRARGKTYTFDVGDATYGNQARYVRLEGKDEVLLLEAAAVRGFEGKVSRLMEPRLAPFSIDDVTGFAVKVGEREAAFDHKDRDQPKLRHFVVRGSEDERSEEAQGLMATLRGLRAREYVEPAKVEGLVRVGSLAIARDKAPAIEVVVYEADDGYFVQVGPWVGLVPPSRGKNLVEDMTAVTPVE